MNQTQIMVLKQIMNQEQMMNQKKNNESETNDDSNPNDMPKTNTTDTNAETNTTDTNANTNTTNTRLPERRSKAIEIQLGEISQGQDYSQDYSDLKAVESFEPEPSA